jgi:hypothetical protein
VNQIGYSRDILSSIPERSSASSRRQYTAGKMRDVAACVPSAVEHLRGPGQSINMNPQGMKVLRRSDPERYRSRVAQ